MEVKLYVDYEKVKMIIDNILPKYIGTPGSGYFGERMIKEKDILYILAKLAEKKEK